MDPITYLLSGGFWLFIGLVLVYLFNYDRMAADRKAKDEAERKQKEREILYKKKTELSARLRKHKILMDAQKNLN